MTDILRTLKVHSKRPVSKYLLGTLRIVDENIRALDKSYFLAGAQARELMLVHVFGITTAIATSDVDIGVFVEDWNTFQTLKGRLITTGHFKDDPQRIHRLLSTTTDIPIDLLPFGGVENIKGTIAWPPEMEQIMCVAGYVEAARSSIMVQIDNGLTVPVASLPALLVLKLFAWLDRHAYEKKDAIDIWIILNSYYEAGNEDRLYGEAHELAAESKWDMQLAGVKLLGKDVAKICEPETTKQLIHAFTPENLRQIKDDILTYRPRTRANWDSPRVEQYIDAFWHHLS
jgi:predicted nucleotidyltransferase